MLDLLTAEQYLRRISISRRVEPTDEGLNLLHRQHTLHVPFENLDVYHKKLFTLEPEAIFKKVVVENRGGYCYELNLLFAHLLRHVGFAVKLISARIVSEGQSLGPKFDHLCLHVQTTKPYLADVGYGDLFLTPIEISNGRKTDGRNHFTIEDHHEGKCLSMSTEGIAFEKRYVFTLDEVTIDDFKQINFEKQTHGESYFVKNLVCTRPTPDGRLTIFNDQLIERTPSGKKETKIENPLHLHQLLKNLFNITIHK